MRPLQTCLVLSCVGVCLTLACLTADAAGGSGRAWVSDSTWTDHDGQPAPKPRDREPNFYGYLFREAIVEPVSHAADIPDKLIGISAALGARPRREAADVNAFDEVPNSTWFTNRNHIRPVPVSQLLQGPDSTLLPSKPWTITHAKSGGASAGFQVKDAAGRKWLVKLDWHGFPQLSSGADMVARTLLHAAGYNVPHNEPVRFRREDLLISEEKTLTSADLDRILEKGAQTPGGEYLATASLFLPGHAVGSTSLGRRRPDDRNDWYTHSGRRELRGLYVVSSWLGFWDTKQPNFLDMFDSTAAGQGHVKHYILDPGSSFGADADGEKRLEKGYENAIDLGWIGRRLVTLGFVQEPWRRARQDPGIPSFGRFESREFRPRGFKPEVPNPAFRAMTDRDAYWGAKIVASFSDAQIRAAVGAAHYEDPRTPELLVRNLIERRDKIARYWFGRVAPLDFFVVQDGRLRFHDLEADLGITPPRHYDVEILRRHMRLDSPDLPLEGVDGPSVTLELSVEGSAAKATRVELRRKGADWVVTRIRHG